MSDLILSYEAEPFEILIGSRHLTLLRVKDLERFVDRDALLRDAAEEPPYWAHLWTGAVTLARYVEERVECRNQHVLDLGCGLGLVGIVAARKGGHVMFADKEPEALAFATVNAQLNSCSLFEAKQVDFTDETLEQRFSLILGAEIVYDRLAFATLTNFLACHLSPDGRAVLADAKRTNTEEFYRQLHQRGLAWEQEEISEREDNVPLTVSIVTVYRE